MTFPYLHLCIQDDAGNIRDDCQITIRHRSVGTPLATPYSDEDGNTGLGNPYTAADGRLAGCYLAEGRYSVEAYDPETAQDIELPDVSVFLTPLGQGVTRVHTTSGDVTITEDDVVVVVNKTVGAATDVILPPSADLVSSELTIKDGKGDAASNNITLVPDGSETIDGLSEVVITLNYGLAKLRKNESGGWYLLQAS